MKKFLSKIRRRETPFFIALYDAAFRLKRINMPCFFLPLYRWIAFVRLGLIHSGRRIIAFIYYEPMFRSMCEQVGKNLNYVKTRQGFPYFHGPICIFLGENVTVHGRMALSAASLLNDPRFIVGNSTYLGPGLSISVCKEISIGKSCLIASNVTISDNDGHPIDPIKRAKGESIDLEDVSPVRIGNNVWIGDGTIVLKGVSIGDGSIVGARSVVNSDIPPHSIAVGNPAKIVKKVSNFPYNQFQ